MMGIPIVNGRAFARADIARGPAVVINETMAERSTGSNPVGGRAASGSGSSIPGSPSSGSPRTSSRAGSTRRPGTELYFLAEQAAAAGFPERNMNVVVRSALPAASLRGVVEAAVRESDPTLPMIS